MTDQSIPLNKRCRHCDTVKPFWQFIKNKSSKDGLRPRCKTCDYPKIDRDILIAKRCTKCRFEKSIKNFSCNPTKRSGRDSWCKKCKNEHRRERLGRKARVYRQPGAQEKVCHVCKTEKPVSEFWTDESRPDLVTYYCKECGKQNARRVARSAQWLKRTLKQRYNISLTEYEAMLDDQGHKCAICRIDFSTLSQRPSVDHCHRTSHVRGVLCPKCNAGLGCFNDNPETMLNAIEYLKKHG